jgi:DNA-directed RNA polymerase I, II, and III subunit RPABC5
LFNILTKMIIPVRCFTCGEVLGNKYRYYLREVRKRKSQKNVDVDRIVYLTIDNVHKTPEGEVMDELQLVKQCCRRHILTHVDIE